MLLRDLADAALEDDAPLPGADFAYHKARHARAELARLEAELSESVGLLQNPLRWQRLMLGYGLVGGLVFLSMATW